MRALIALWVIFFMACGFLTWSGSKKISRFEETCTTLGGVHVKTYQGFVCIKPGEVT